MTGTRDQGFNRRGFVLGTVSGAALAMAPTLSGAGPDSSNKKTVLAQIPKMHVENIKRLFRENPALEAKLQNLMGYGPDRASLVNKQLYMELNIIAAAKYGLPAKSR